MRHQVFGDAVLRQIVELSHVVQGRAEGPKLLVIRPERAEAPSPGHRPGYNSNLQGAL